ncbi:5'-3' exoribonuclease 4 [Sesamum angolense]|uniref:5'-3' exoribonuclease 4 n=1 Tax=Sesamum angolense TaxID=2727404 RepID=A0AAE1T7V4_9LAMI|nr:5'-3' exoribonuclease 4 [Sesamum angolense]
MFDLLYIHPRHPLAAQITLYYRLCDMEKLPWTIDSVASGGMNGFMWLTKRNGLKQVFPSPVNGLEDITNNQVLNITYLNPAPHAHIPKPPEGVNMPEKNSYRCFYHDERSEENWPKFNVESFNEEYPLNMRVLSENADTAPDFYMVIVTHMASQILRPIDIKPLPTLWHEDNGGRNQLGKERPRVSGAISGPMLGEAAYRLVHNTLNIKPERVNYRNTQGNHVTNRLRPAGPPGYERGVSEGQNSLNHQALYRERVAGQSGYNRGAGRYRYQEQGYYDDSYSPNGYYSPRAPAGNVRYGISSNDMQNNRQSFYVQDRYAYQEQHHDLRTGMSALTIEGGFRTTPVAGISQRSSNVGQVPHVRPQLAQISGPIPSPPPKWIGRRPAGNAVMYASQQQSSAPAGHEKQGRMVYQVQSKMVFQVNCAGFLESSIVGDSGSRPLFST